MTYKHDSNETDDLEPLTPLERLLANAIQQSPDSTAYEDPRFVAWLIRDADARLTPAERRDN